MKTPDQNNLNEDQLNELLKNSLADENAPAVDDSFYEKLSSQVYASTIAVEIDPVREKEMLSKLGAAKLTTAKWWMLGGLGIAVVGTVAYFILNSNQSKIITEAIPQPVVVETERK